MCNKTTCWITSISIYTLFYFISLRWSLSELFKWKRCQFPPYTELLHYLLNVEPFSTWNSISCPQSFICTSNKSWNTWLLRWREDRNGAKDKEGRICMICLCVSPFKHNNPQTDAKWSSTIPLLLSFFSEATQARGDEERGLVRSQWKIGKNEGIKKRS